MFLGIRKLNPQEQKEKSKLGFSNGFSYIVMYGTVHVTVMAIGFIL